MKFRSTTYLVFKEVVLVFLFIDNAKRRWLIWFGLVYGVWHHFQQYNNYSVIYRI